MEIRPFQGWRYAATGGDVSAFLAPPYDVLSAADKDLLLAAEPRNVVAVDLPHSPPAADAPDEAYRRAAEALDAWRSEGLLRRDPRPALYAYEQSYAWAGRRHVRRAVVAAVRLRPLGEGIHPHEKTFSGPKADRLKLRRFTGMQMSPVLGFHDGPTDAAEALFAAAGEAPDAVATLGGVRERLWAVSDPAAVARAADALAGADLFIADGHHRYTTALTYRDGLGDLPADHPANFVMFVLVAADDPGLTVLPTHRVIAGMRDVDAGGFRRLTRGVLDHRAVEITPDDAADAGAFLARFGRGAMGFALGGETIVSRLTDPTAMDRVAAERVPAWRALDVAVLHRLVLDHCLADLKTNRMLIDYVADGRAALAAARAGRADLVCLLQPTPLDAVQRIARAGEVMPHKSTYFYPKAATGMVLYPLT